MAEKFFVCIVVHVLLADSMHQMIGLQANNVMQTIKGRYMRPCIKMAFSFQITYKAATSYQLL